MTVAGAMTISGCPLGPVPPRKWSHETVLVAEQSQKPRHCAGREGAAYSQGGNPCYRLQVQPDEMLSFWLMEASSLLHMCSRGLSDSHKDVR